MSQPTHPLAQATGAIRLADVTVDFGDGARTVQALKGLDLSVEPGEFVSVLGPSGCGKSTLIGAIAGFRRLSAGALTVSGRAVPGPGPERGVVFQQHMLFPWKSVLANVEFGLKMQGLGARERRDRATEMLAHVGLAGFLRHYPHQLSGGMQQRVALARVLVNRPGVLLMDEPFGALDAQNRLRMQQTLLSLWHELHMTVVFVTHDVDEAVFLSDRIVVLTERPAHVRTDLRVPLDRPRNAFTLTSPAYSRVRREALELLLDESLERQLRGAAALP
jgi:NitT/TauT family transport system ATP-binding protein